MRAIAGMARSYKNAPLGNIERGETIADRVRSYAASGFRRSGLRPRLPSG
jgi:hypothetical protein